MKFKDLTGRYARGPRWSHIHHGEIPAAAIPNMVGKYKGEVEILEEFAGASLKATYEPLFLYFKERAGKAAQGLR